MAVAVRVLHVRLLAIAALTIYATNKAEILFNFEESHM